MKRIKLTRGKFALVDDVDFDYLNQWKWFCEASHHAARDQHIGMDGKKEIKKRIKMHRLIMNPPANMEVDHIDGNCLNNQRNNLRVVTHAQNQKNLKRPITNTSGYKGVSWSKARQKWIAAIYHGKMYNLGGYDTKEEAARKYNEVAIERFGEFARLNNV